MIELSENIDLDNPEFQQAYRILQNTNANVFLTGKAGTGKSTFLRYICSHIHKKYVVLAPTGVAAVNVGGATIHSFFQMPLRPVPPDDPDYSVAQLKATSKLSRKKRKLIKELELIIIDEVSMVRPDMIDFIDRSLRAVTGNRRIPFGGIQLLLVGDIFQLEPVVTTETKAILSKFYPGFFFFNARIYEQTKLIAIELKKIYRQTDKKFIGLLDRIRLNQATPSDLAILNSRVVDMENTIDSSDGRFGITLTSRRDTANAINQQKLKDLPGKEIIFRGKITDDFPERILPTDLELHLKAGCQVMMIRNDKEKRWVNGTLARIKELSKKKIIIELEDGTTESVEQEEWQNINYTYDEATRKVKEEIIGRFKQYPLKAAWALTIHKSQGLTFSNVTIDMEGGAFSAGQTYVALSRCRSLEGLSFINPIMHNDIIVSRGAADFSRNFNDNKSSELVMRESEAKMLSKSAEKLFEEEKFQEAAEALWMINDLTGALGRESVRRLVSSRLSIISTLKDELKKKDKLLRDISEEFTELAEISMAEGGDAESALRNYMKAYEVNPGNRKARLGMAKAYVGLGERDKATGILNEFLKRKDSYAYDANMIKGVMNMAASNWSGAALNFMAAHKLKPSERDPIVHLVDLYEKTGQDEMASLMGSLLSDIDGD